MSISDRLDQIAARAEAATEGPWVVNGPDEDWAVISSGPDSVFHPYSAHGICEGCECGDGAAHVAIGIEDAEFIAHARTTVPALVAALRAVLDVCETYPVPPRDKDVTGDVLAGMERLERLVRAAIHDALGEEA